MRLRWFGEPWPSAAAPAPVCDDSRFRVAAPVGKVCVGCGQPVAPGERGVVMGATGEVPHRFQLVVEGQPRTVCAEHIDCHINEVLPGYGANIERAPS